MILIIVPMINGRSRKPPAIGQVGDKHYAFMGLERTGGIVFYDITDPAALIFVEWITNRNYTVDIENDLA